MGAMVACMAVRKAERAQAGRRGPCTRCAPRSCAPRERSRARARRQRTPSGSRAPAARAQSHRRWAPAHSRRTRWTPRRRRSCARCRSTSAASGTTSRRRPRRRARGGSAWRPPCGWPTRWRSRCVAGRSHCAPLPGPFVLHQPELVRKQGCHFVKSQAAHWVRGRFRNPDGTIRMHKGTNHTAGRAWTCCSRPALAAPVQPARRRDGCPPGAPRPGARDRGGARERGDALRVHLRPGGGVPAQARARLFPHPRLLHTRVFYPLVF